MTEKNSSTQKKRRPPKKISERYLENAGLFYLERYASSSENFRRVMRRKINRSAKHHEDDPETFYPMLETLIERYIQSGLLNDGLYCFSKVRSLKSRGNSDRMIFAKLMQKGLSQDVISSAIEEYNEREGYDTKRDSEYEAAVKYAKKRRFGPYRTPPNPERFEKDMAAMARAGFKYDMIKDVLNIDEDLIDYAD